jgi:hypothetical protein
MLAEARLGKLSSPWPTMEEVGANDMAIAHDGKVPGVCNVPICARVTICEYLLQAICYALRLV